jgi:hypothetical protein
LHAVGFVLPRAVQRVTSSAPSVAARACRHGFAPACRNTDCRRRRSSTGPAILSMASCHARPTSHPCHPCHPPSQHTPVPHPISPRPPLSLSRSLSLAPHPQCPHRPAVRTVALALAWAAPAIYCAFVGVLGCSWVFLGVIAAALCCERKRLLDAVAWERWRRSSGVKRWHRSTVYCGIERRPRSRRINGVNCAHGSIAQCWQPEIRLGWYAQIYAR